VISPNSWTPILAAVKKIQRLEPEEGEAVN
jgi:hypothetical protein